MLDIILILCLAIITTALNVRTLSITTKLMSHAQSYRTSTHPVVTRHFRTTDTIISILATISSTCIIGSLLFTSVISTAPLTVLFILMGVCVGSLYLYDLQNQNYRRLNTHNIQRSL